MADVKATKRGAEIIKEAFVGLGNVKQFDESYTASTDDKYACEIRVITPPEGKDPDEFVRSSGSDAYFKHLEHAPLLLDFEIHARDLRPRRVRPPPRPPPGPRRPHQLAERTGLAPR